MSGIAQNNTSNTRQLQQTGGLFQTGPGSSFLIHDGHFTQHNQAPTVHYCYDSDDPFKHLQAHVAPSAYASQQDGEAPKCHPNTRKAVLDEIMNWVILEATRIQWILWLNGAAGAGKSAIARSIVDLCTERDIVIAKFFFFRTDPTRNNLAHLVATLAYQLIQVIPGLDVIILPRIRSDPLIFNQSLETQFQVLIFDPLLELHKKFPFSRPLLLLFDGVDECDGHTSQTGFIRTISKFVELKSFPLLALFSSRAENQIKMEFRSTQIAKTTHPLPLDDHYLPDQDIRLFLTDSFFSVKETHPFNDLLDHNWPTPELVEEIVTKSSGQFIYASVVMKFISAPHLHPAQQLNIIRGLRPSGTLTPFAELDALYRHIFSQVRDIARTTLILVYFILGNATLRRCAEVLDISQADIHIALADLTSVVSVSSTKNGEIRFLHASLPDFLLDRARSQEFYIDRAYWSTQLSIGFFDKVASRQVIDYFYILGHLPHAECTPDLRARILSFNPSQMRDTYSTSTWSSYLTDIQNMNFGDGGEVYHQQLNVVTRYVKKRNPDQLWSLEEKHDIAVILAQIESEAVEKSKRKTRERKSAFGMMIRSLLK
ncbi:hypothetical protein HYPSUDRAFT_167075 [Hypholoma sublateritium FD-334 SS-4]|uniref:Nephrocystin 3-like N-terminal domain-containing protein n=1 Tax=Hypholoma sublateritium (strain FD-334 SS-4) TaxID=945553 RepID=A0A0D2L0Z9_HYPSF|nr:hypothetical protein HYPSUDRAFT_167075 [Hypholoma sublateritium FD-334 SS-4]